MVRPYADDLAYIHDVGFTDFIRGAAPGILEIFARAGVDAGRVIDLGCGGGVWARELVKVGHDVLGIDFSAAHVAMARQRVPQATFRRGSFLDARLPSCAAVTSLGEVFSYLFDADVGPRSLGGLFRRVHDALRPGGVFVFDLLENYPRCRRGPLIHHRQGKDWAILYRADVKGATLTRTITTFRRVAKLYRRGEEVHHLRFFDPAEITGSLRRTGFRVRRLRGYGSERFRPGHVGFLARKP